MVVLIACLCISTSEGLRLAPFPIFELSEVEVTKKQLRSSASNEISNKYNPTTMPTRPMKRGKQQVLDIDNQPSESTRRLAFHPVFLPVTEEVAGVVSPILSTAIPSRAPPFVS